MKCFLAVIFKPLEMVHMLPLTHKLSQATYFWPLSKLSKNLHQRFQKQPWKTVKHFCLIFPNAAKCTQVASNLFQSHRTRKDAGIGIFSILISAALHALMPSIFFLYQTSHYWQTFYFRNSKLTMKTNQGLKWL